MSFKKISRGYTQGSNLILIFALLAMTFKIQCDKRFLVLLLTPYGKLFYLEILIRFLKLFSSCLQEVLL